LSGVGGGRGEGEGEERRGEGGGGEGRDMRIQWLKFVCCVIIGEPYMLTWDAAARRALGVVGVGLLDSFALFLSVRDVRRGTRRGAPGQEGHISMHHRGPAETARRKRHRPADGRTPRPHGPHSRKRAPLRQRPRTARPAHALDNAKHLSSTGGRHSRPRSRAVRHRLFGTTWLRNVR